MVLLCAPTSAQAVGGRADSPGKGTVELFTQRGGQSRDRRGMWGRWWRGSSEFQKNNDDVKAAYKEAADRAAKSTASVLADGEVVALATVVDADGFLVTKASLLPADEKLICQLSDGEKVDAAIAGRDDDFDLALLKIDGRKLTPVVWRKEPADVGTFAAAVDQDGNVIGVGVVSTDPRRVRGTRNASPPRAWLGVSLGGGSSGTGITEVIARTAAQRAGLKPGDVIRGIGGQEMRSMDQVKSTIGRANPGDKVVIMVKRGDESLEISATLGRPPADASPQDQWGGGPFSVRREDFPEVITHDTIVRPEQCGGPLIDTDGHVIGVNIARALRVTTYAVPAATIEQLVAELKKS